ncbi:Proteinaceous RNase P 3 [Rhynchospora pubera]|uniref:ribonuclease P n=1 Tax=Rhynchospora pubera TaxID=906938 RepID=A0AAV8C3J1_9POAL|nr:Proteinaceous RNase P 3 [Rhynchospora pubera]
MGTPQNPKSKKAKNGTKEGNLTHALVTCTKSGDVSAAISALNAAISTGVRPSANNFNSILHLLSSQASLDPTLVDSAFNLFDQMLSYNITPSESTITSMARIACHKSDGGDLSFGLVKSMNDKYGIMPRLRTYTPCLSFFCERLQAEKAYEVEDHMGTMGISPEESEISKLLEVSSKTGNGDKVYVYMQMLRNHVATVGYATSEATEGWFKSEKASEVGCVNWEEESVREVILKNGGGYFGGGWLGTGEWEVKKGRIGIDGVCEGCGKKLRGVDLGELERQGFMEKVAGFAIERETKANFSNFQKWLESHPGYEFIIDAANVGLYQQNFADGGFSLSQLDAVVREAKEVCNGKWPLVVLHNRRMAALSENPSNRMLLEHWKSLGALYTTPSGSNDDWYWIYATISQKALLVTNDEMRDHIFELLGSSSFFPTWKERHQVKYTFKKGKLVLVMPPTYSSVIQESENGSWHMPIGDKCEDERKRTWLCISRSISNNVSNRTNAVDGIDEDKINIEQNGASSLIGKRKERS